MWIDMTEFWICLAVLAVINVVNFVLYVEDKRRARQSLYRIPEALLLFVSFFGGAAGGLMAMQTVRHKTRHWYFTALNVLGLIWQSALLLYIFVTRVMTL